MSFYHTIYNKSEKTHGETQTLLWENSNPNTAFTPKKIEINLSEYNGCIIEFNNSVSSATLLTRIKCEKTSMSAGGQVFLNTDLSTSRISTISNDGVTFSDAHLNSDINNSYCIPAKIYGYKQFN